MSTVHASGSAAADVKRAVGIAVLLLDLGPCQLLAAGAGCVSDVRSVALAAGARRGDWRGTRDEERAHMR
eukprot:3809312-Prymnesium_polylepis.1